MTTIKPTSPIPSNEQVVKAEDLVFGGGEGERARCPVTNRRYENGSGALPHAEQTKMFQREAALAERKAALEREEAERAAAAFAAAAAPALRLVRTPA
jgi:hypothetical protein